MFYSRKIIGDRTLCFIDICFGINTGNVTVGNIGSATQMNYTVIGYQGGIPLDNVREMIYKDVPKLQTGLMSQIPRILTIITIEFAITTVHD